MTHKKPHILITNDDGIAAPGIAHLARALHEEFRVTVVAPKHEQSAKSTSVTLFESLYVEKTNCIPPVEAWSVSGTPADCVRLGLIAITEQIPDLIVSGINKGSNHGRTVLFSGTVGGVIEGVLRGIPGIAFSSYNYEEPRYECFEAYVPRIVRYVLNHPLPRGTLLNVNFPDIVSKQLTIKGIKMTTQGRKYWKEDLDSLPSYRGEGEYFLDAKISDCTDSEDSDSFWLDQGWITAVPVHVDELTDRNYLSIQREHFENQVNERQP